MEKQLVKALRELGLSKGPLYDATRQYGMNLIKELGNISDYELITHLHSFTEGYKAKG